MGLKKRVGGTPVVAVLSPPPAECKEVEKGRGIRPLYSGQMFFLGIMQKRSKTGRGFTCCSGLILPRQNAKIPPNDGGGMGHGPVPCPLHGYPPPPPTREPQKEITHPPSLNKAAIRVMNVTNSIVYDSVYKLHIESGSIS